MLCNVDHAAHVDWLAVAVAGILRDAGVGEGGEGRGLGRVEGFTGALVMLMRLAGLFNMEVWVGWLDLLN